MCATLSPTEIRICRYYSPFHRNIITRMPGTSWITHRPREKFEFVDFQFSNDNHKHPEVKTFQTFNRPVFLSYYTSPPEHCDLVIDVDIPASATQSEITPGVYRYNALPPSEPVSVMKNVSVLFLLLRVRTNAMSLIEVPRPPYLRQWQREKTY